MAGSGARPRRARRRSESHGKAASGRRSSMFAGLRQFGRKVRPCRRRRASPCQLRPEADVRAIAAPRLPAETNSSAAAAAAAATTTTNTPTAHPLSSRTPSDTADSCLSSSMPVRSFVRPVQKRSLSRSFIRGAVRCHGTRPWMPSRRASTAYVLGSFRRHRSCRRRYRHCHRCEISPPTSRPHRHSPSRVTHPIPLPPRTHQYVQPVPQKEPTYEDFKEAYIDTVQTLERLATKEWAQTEVRSNVPLRNVDRRLM